MQNVYKIYTNNIKMLVVYAYFVFQLDMACLFRHTAQ